MATPMSKSLHALTPAQFQLIEHAQRDFPIVERPFLALAERLGMEEQVLIDAVIALQESGVVSRLGPVFDHKKAGASTLAAVAVPPDELDRVADQVSQFAAVNHNYAREHRFNLWFVVATQNEERLQQVLQDIEQAIGYPVMNLPMLKQFHIDLGFKIEWEQVHGE